MSSNEEIKSEIVLDIIRETGEKQYLNRFCRDPKTQEIKYYLESSDNRTLLIHQGDLTGPNIAEATQCLIHTGTTDLQFLLPSGQNKQLLQMHHNHHTFPFFHGKTFFEWNGKKYHWKGHTALIEDDTGILIAALHTRFLDDPSRLGTLVVTGEGVRRGMVDLVVVSCLVMQERSDEGKLSTELARERIQATGLVMF